MGKSRMMGAGNASASLYKCDPNEPTGGGSKKQGLNSRVGLDIWSNPAIQNKSNGTGRFKLFTINQLGGVGPGNSMFGGRFNRADGIQTQYSNTYLEFPNAQGTENWTDGINKTQISLDGIIINVNIKGTISGIGLNSEGLAYNDGTTLSTIPWSVLKTKIQAVEALSSASNSNTLNVNDTLQIQSGETSDIFSYIQLTTHTGLLQMILSPDGITKNYGNPGDVLTSGGSMGNMSWQPNHAQNQQGTYMCDPDINSGRISFSIAFTVTPIVTISQMTTGPLVLLAVTDITLTDFGFKASSTNIGSINWKT